MTIVVGIKTENGVILACDSQGSNGWDKTDRLDQKIFTAHGIGYGFTTSYRMGQILRYHTYEVLSSMRHTDLFGYVVTCLVPMYRQVLADHGFKREESGVESGGTFLIAIDGELFIIEDDFQVGVSKKSYDAVGCGSSYALGYLYACEGMNPEVVVKVASGAVEAAIEFSNGCGGAVVVKEFLNAT